MDNKTERQMREIASLLERLARQSLEMQKQLLTLQMQIKELAK